MAEIKIPYVQRYRLLDYNLLTNWILRNDWCQFLDDQRSGVGISFTNNHDGLCQCSAVSGLPAQEGKRNRIANIHHHPNLALSYSCQALG